MEDQFESITRVPVARTTRRLDATWASRQGIILRLLLALVANPDRHTGAPTMGAMIEDIAAVRITTIVQCRHTPEEMIVVHITIVDLEGPLTTATILAHHPRIAQSILETIPENIRETIQGNTQRTTETTTRGMLAATLPIIQGEVHFTKTKTAPVMQIHVRVLTMTTPDSRDFPEPIDHYLLAEMI